MSHFIFPYKGVGNHSFGVATSLCTETDRDVLPDSAKVLEERMHAKGKSRKPLKSWEIIPARRLDHVLSGRNTKARPLGSWTTQVYEDGVVIGEWLNIQFDPDAGFYEDFYAGFERFRPADADWEWY